MNQTYDPVTSALTGHLPFHLILAALLTWPIALGLLRLYTRAVQRSMNRRAEGDSATASPPPTPPTPPTPGSAGASTATLHALPDSSPAGPEVERLTARLVAGPRQAALVYGAAGCAYTLFMAATQLVSSGIEILPVRLLFYAWTFGWPVVLTRGMVGATSGRARLMTVAVYFLGLTVIGAIGISRSPDLTWLQVFLPWLMYDLPASILLLTYLSRRVRAVGPLVGAFLLLALIGSDVITSVAASDDRYLRLVIDVTSAVGLDGTETFVAMLLTGFLLFGIIGWIALVWIRRGYQAKRLSDESLTVDAVWLLFTVAYSMDLAFDHPAWVLVGACAFLVFKVAVRAGFAVLARRGGAEPRHPTLLVLRSFSIGRDSDWMFDVIGRHWRRVGSIQMIAGIDLVARTVEPHEFLDFVSGKLSRRFIDGEATLDLRLRERDLAPDRDLRFRVNEFFCYDNTWKMVLSRLVRESDAVVMDLRGFSRQNAGCLFELEELARLVPLDRVVFLADRRTDEALLAATLGDRRAGVFRLESARDIRTGPLMRTLAAAAMSPAHLAV